MTNSLFEEWRAYEKLVEQDYIGHKRFFQCLEEKVDRRFKKPVSILDLGCGDAAPIRDMLARLSVERYCGVDDSATALVRASPTSSGDSTRIPLPPMASLTWANDGLVRSVPA